MGYELKTVHEVWHFKDSASGLFAEYVNTWLKLKQESAGWPRWCTTPQQKNAYLQQYKQKEGIPLNYDSIKKNPGLKATAKLMFNSNQSFHQELSTGDDKNIAKPPLARATRSLEPRREADETGNMYQKKYVNLSVDTGCKLRLLIYANV